MLVVPDLINNHINDVFNCTTKWPSRTHNKKENHDDSRKKQQCFNDLLGGFIVQHLHNFILLNVIL
jgi:hypothetical protein